MWRIIVFKIATLALISHRVNGEEHDSNDFGTNLVTKLRNDANLDLSVDEEYEDLRAELLAYHTTLTKLSHDSARRSMMTTPCWQMGGICINYKLCREQHGRYLTQALGCRDKLNVCCFAWNRFKVKDMREHGIDGPFPWSIHYEAGGLGVVSNERNSIKNKKVLKQKNARDKNKNGNKIESTKEKGKNTKDNKNGGEKNKSKGKKGRKKSRGKKDNNKKRKEGKTNDENKKSDSTTEKNNNKSEKEENEDNKNSNENKENFTEDKHSESEKINNQKDEKPEDRQSDNKKVENKTVFEDHTESDYYTYEDEEDNDKQQKTKINARKQLTVKYPTFVVDTDDDKKLKSITLRIPITKNLRKKLYELNVNDKVISRNNVEKQNDNIDQRNTEILALLLKTV